jgi:translation initiation factor IF-3
MFRGREQSRPELGLRLLERLAVDVTELGFVEATPKQDGRNMIMVLAPHKSRAALGKEEHPSDVEGAEVTDLVAEAAYDTETATTE